MSATMQNVCAIFDVNQISYCGNAFVHELAVIGTGKWDQPYSCIYDARECVVSQYANSATVYGLTVDADGSNWRDVYLDLVNHWKYFKSNDKCRVGVIGNEQFVGVLNYLNIDAVNLIDVVNSSCYYCDHKNPYQQFACGRYYASEKGCAASRVTYYRDWLIQNVK